MNTRIAPGWGARTMRAGAGAVVSVLLAVTPVSAHSNKPHMPTPGPATATPMEEQHMERDGSLLTLTVQRRAVLGDAVRLEARLTSDEGDPITGAVVTFVSPATWGEEISGDMILGRARTDREGLAALTMVVRRAGELRVTAAFAGTPSFGPSNRSSPITIVGDDQLYTPRVGIRLPGAGGWAIALVIGTVWALFFVAARRAHAIATSAAATGAASVGRRDVLRTAGVTIGVQAALAAIGSGLVALVTRSPRTHANIDRRAPTLYHRTPLALVGHEAHMRAMPGVLERDVSFSRDVMPILMARAGPHVMLPENSPPPSGVRLDAYDHIMRSPELVVPGKPEESHLIKVLLDPAMQMPPGLPPLPDAEIQILVSWVAQGARDN